MSILGVIVRSRPDGLRALEQRLRALPGVDVADRTDAADGRVVAVIEDTADGPAAATMGAIALWPEVINTSLVWEYSGAESPAPEAVAGYGDWRQSLAAAPARQRGAS
jgi:periplasmic nitrate reductase NapD